jgi:branched-chain amino acid transport system ATP-binding protein
VSSTATAAGATAAAGEDHDIVFDVRGITLRFGGVTSLDDISLQMRRGEILAVIGPNGAGKTSLFNSLTGVYTPQEGEILLAARPGDTPVSVLGKKTHVVNHMGVARTFQNIRLFPALTALENVKVGVETRQRRSGPVSAMLGLPWQRREERESTQAAYALLDRVGLAARANELASALAYGEQRRLEIARALGTQPGVILLDEPAAGTNPVEKRELAALIRQINDDGVGVLLIEHDMKLVMSVADRIVVLNFGRRIAEGTPEQIQRDPAVVAAYLGTSAEEAAEELATHERPELHTIDISGGVSGATAAPSAPTAPAGTDEPGGQPA